MEHIFEQRDLMNLIQEDLKTNGKQNHNTTSRKLIALLIIVLIIGAAFTMLLGAVTYKLLDEPNFTITTIIFLVIYLFCGGLFIWIMLTVKKDKSVVMGNLNFTQFYQAGLENLLKTSLEEFELTNKFLEHNFSLQQLNENPDILKREVLSFKLAGMRIAYGTTAIKTDTIRDDKNNICKKNFTQTFVVLNNDQRLTQGRINLYFENNFLPVKEQLKAIQLESDEFNKYVQVYGEDEISTRRYLTPKRMQNIMSLDYHLQQSKFKFLYIDKNEIIGEAKNFLSSHIDNDGLTDLEKMTNDDDFAKFIYDKVTIECRDIAEIIKFLKVMVE